jgi:multidrug transporter EmrE-like cation transporter
MKFSARAVDVPVARYTLFGFALAVGLGTAYWNARALERLDLNVAFPTNSALTLISLLAIGAAVFGESLTPSKTLGTLAVILGVYLVNR